MLNESPGREFSGAAGFHSKWMTLEFEYLSEFKNQIRQYFIKRIWDAYGFEEWKKTGDGNLLQPSLSQINSFQTINIYIFFYILA
jgi:hypothetical protein